MSDLAAPEPQPEAPYAAPPKGALSVIFVIVLADMLGFGVIIPLLPFYAKNFHASDLQVGFIFSIYSLCQMIGSPVLGVLSDRWGRRPILILSLLGSVVGYLVLALASWGTWANPLHGLLLVYLSRLIDGFTGGNISTAQAYISDATPPERRARAMGMIGAAFGIGFSIGPFVGGVLGHYHPAWPAIAAALLTLAAVMLTYVRLPETRHHVPSEGEIFLHPSRFTPILRNSAIMQFMLIAFFSMIAFVMLEAVYAIFLKDIYKYGPREVGWFFALAGVTIIVVQGALLGPLTRRFGEWPLVVAGPLLVTTAMLIYVQAGFRPLVWLLVAAGIVNACGRSIQMPTLSSLLSQQSNPTMHGTVFGLHFMLSSLARVIGPIIAGAIFTAHPTGPFLVAGSITLAVAMWTIWLRARQSSPEPELEPAQATAPQLK